MGSFDVCVSYVHTHLLFLILSSLLQHDQGKEGDAIGGHRMN